MRPEALPSLEQISAERLIEAASALPDWLGTTGKGDTIHFAPVIDGVILTQPPLQAIASGVAKHIPTIIGTNKDECLFYPFADPTWREADEETLIQRVKQQVGDAPERAQLAQQMQRAWVAFARHGDPNTPELPIWPRYDLEQRATMLFDRESTVQNDPNARARQSCANAVQTLCRRLDLSLSFCQEPTTRAASSADAVRLYSSSAVTRSIIDAVHV